ncbi:MAG: D-glycero-alpha-D-manno-heptose-1,7-bisphosphate 7-phosphatase, partial [Chloroflexota bacterium]
DDLQLLPRAARAIRMINEMDYLAVVVSNQPGVAKGKCDHAFLEAVDAELSTQLGRQGARLDALYYCLHHPEARVESLQIECDCRKPKPGLLLKAARELHVDLHQSFMVGDSVVDIQAGKAAGCRTILVNGHHQHPPGDSAVRPHHTTSDLLAAIEAIKREEGSAWRSS